MLQQQRAAVWFQDCRYK